MKNINEKILFLSEMQDVLGAVRDLRTVLLETPLPALKVDILFPQHTHCVCDACGKKNYICFLEICYEVGVVGHARDCAECQEGYDRADRD